MGIKYYAERIGRFFKDSDIRFNYLCILGFYDHMSDEKFIRMKYKRLMHKELNLDNPQTYNEKLQWLKLYDRNPLYTKLVDKYEVKKYVSDRIGEEHVVPIFGVYDNVDEIRLEDLPNQFVLKCTHDSGGFVICKDKESFDFESAKRLLAKRMKRNFYKFSREWPYKDVKPRIIAEKFMDSLGKPESIEYKLTCFGGKADLITVCGGIAHSAFDKRTNDFYDRDFNHLPFYVFYKNPPKALPVPKEIDKIIEFSEKLSEGIPEVRVDWYIHDGVIYFGEMTFFTWGGFCVFTPEEWNRTLGDWIILPEKKKEEL